MGNVALRYMPLVADAAGLRREETVQGKRLGRFQTVRPGELDGGLSGGVQNSGKMFARRAGERLSGHGEPAGGLGGDLRGGARRADDAIADGFGGESGEGGQ